MDYSYQKRFDDRRSRNNQNMRSRPCGRSQSQPISCPENRTMPPMGRTAAAPMPREMTSMPYHSYVESEKQSEFPLGMAYVPQQKFQDILPIEEGFQTGTIFQQLDFPFTVGFCARGCDCK